MFRNRKGICRPVVAGKPIGPAALYEIQRICLAQWEPKKEVSSNSFQEDYSLLADSQLESFLRLRVHQRQAGVQILNQRWGHGTSPGLSASNWGKGVEQSPSRWSREQLLHALSELDNVVNLCDPWSNSDSAQFCNSSQPLILAEKSMSDIIKASSQNVLITGSTTEYPKMVSILIILYGTSSYPLGVMSDLHSK